MSQLYIYPNPSASANPSVGTNNTTAPTSSTEIGFIGNSGDLVGVSSTDPLPVEIIAGIANPLPVTDAAAEASLASIDTKVSTAAKQDTAQLSLTSIENSSSASESYLAAINGDTVNINSATASIDSKTPALGQAIMANSSPVVIASNQSAISVTGPLTDTELRATPVPVSISSGLANPLPVQDSAAEASLASIDTKLTSPLSVTGPLTDVQLRATPVPISGTVSTNGLTDAELRASAVPVSLASTTITGSVAVTGPLTDTQLRATPVPVSGTVSTNGLTDAELRATPVDVLGPLTDVELRATPVPVSGTVATSNGLTDTQLRATPVPVSGTVSTGGLTDAELRATAVPVSMTSTTITGSVAVTGPLTDTELRASAVPVSGTVTANLGTIAGVATETTLSALNTKVPSQGQAAMAASMPVVIASNQSSIPVTQGGRTKVNQILVDTSSSNITTGAYLQILASTSAQSTLLEIFIASGEIIKFAVGAAASEVDQFYVFPGGQGQVQLTIPASSRLSVKSATANVTSGYLIVNTYS